MTYTRFFGMIATSVLAMYAMTYLNSWALGHIYFSETRAYMVLYMGAVMAAIMLLWMWGHYDGKGTKFAILGGSALIFAVALFLVRSQATVADVSWMKAMIPHHSIAILTSERANISDPRVQDLANDIIEAQRREIDEMRRLIADLQAGES